MTENNSSNDIGFFGVLQIVFIVLKLTNLIDWSWWLVLLPTLIPLSIIIIGVIIIILVSR